MLLVSTLAHANEINSVDAGCIGTGMVAGLETITPASDFLDPMGGVSIGLSAGVVC
ncbi:MAG: hypothetical protein KTR16_13575 [Acidiferrobacterales bacterium]|nr:hypothetical protein [Acidiferrobacterales bacterium]